MNPFRKCCYLAFNCHNYDVKSDIYNNTTTQHNTYTTTMESLKAPNPVNLFAWMHRGKMKILCQQTGDESAVTSSLLETGGSDVLASRPKKPIPGFHWRLSTCVNFRSGCNSFVGLRQSCSLCLWNWGSLILMRNPFPIYPSRSHRIRTFCSKEAVGCF